MSVDMELRQQGERQPILVMIPYPSTIGFAIGRLIVAFHRMATRLGGDDVHFAFSKLDGTCSSLPFGFSSLIDFNHRTSVNHGELATYIEAHKIRMIFALDLRAEAPCLKAARRAGVHTVVSYWGASMSSIHWWLWPLRRLQVALTRHKPDLFIFESEAMRKHAVWGRGVAKLDTTIVRTGVDIERFKPGPSNVHERFDIPPGRKIIVFMGHCVERKGVHVLLHAVRELDRRDIHVLILGNQPGESAAYEGITDLVTFGGYQPPQDIPSLLAGCWAGCIPSTGWDSFPMSSLEMQACGLPMFVSDLQGCPETITNKTGMVVRAGDHEDLAEAILTLIEDPARRERMSVAARASMERLTVALQVDELVEAVTSAIPVRVLRAMEYARGCREAAESHPGLYDRN